MDSSHLIETMRQLDLTDATLATLLGVTPRAIRAYRNEERPIHGAVARLLYLIERYPSIRKELSELTNFAIDFPPRRGHI